MKKSAALAGFAAVASILGGCESFPSFGRPTPPAPLDRAQILAPSSTCADVTTEVYFDTGVTALNADARRALGLTVDQLKACAITSVTIIGLADATGAPSANQALSAQRAASVRSALEAAGVNPALIGLRAQGEQGAVTNSGEVNPLRRQAQIEFKLTPR